MNKKDSPFVNYFLTMAFVFLVVIIIISMISMSRYVFTEDTYFASHMKTTKNLLQNIDEVKKTSIETIDINETEVRIPELENFLRINYNDFHITDMSYYNANENKSVLTVFFDSTIHSIGNIHYLKIKNIEDLTRGTAIAYMIDNSAKIGLFISSNGDKITIVDVENRQQVIDFEKEEILGKVIIIENVQN